MTRPVGIDHPRRFRSARILWGQVLERAGELDELPARVPRLGEDVRVDAPGREIIRVGEESLSNSFAACGGGGRLESGGTSTASGSAGCSGFGAGFALPSWTRFAARRRL